MIDDCLTRMLTKSSEIESCLEDLEAASKTGFPTRRARGQQRTGDDVLRLLIDALGQLSGELSDLRDEQRILRTQVDELHRAVLSDDV
jgi:hypothetical protein